MKAKRQRWSQICDHLRKLRFSPNLPYAFTEHGAIMLAAVLNSPVAVKASIQVVRAFVKLRADAYSQCRAGPKARFDWRRKYDSQFKVVFDAIRQLMTPTEKPKRKIGFHREREKG